MDNLTKIFWKNEAVRLNKELDKEKAKFDKLKQLWREKCRRMEIMSGEVAIFELECLIDELSSKQEGEK
jgi:hypothetical protein